MTARLLSAVLLLTAVAVALGRFAELNGPVMDGVFRPAAAVHVGVAISLRQGGLIAPALHAGLYVTDQSSGNFTNVFTLEPRRYGLTAGVKF